MAIPAIMRTWPHGMGRSGSLAPASLVAMITPTITMARSRASTP